jgi:menaquinone-specific isochorismate synthase
MSSQLVQAVAQKFEQLASSTADSALTGFCHFSLPAEMVLGSSTQNRALHPQALFLNRQGTEYWGVGAVELYRSQKELEQGVETWTTKQSGDNNSWLIGGRTFSPLHSTSSEWSDFSDYFFFLPRFAFLRHQNSLGTLTINLQGATSNQLPALLSQLAELINSTTYYPLPKPHSSTALPPQSEFEQMVDDGVEKIRQRELSKYVLSRRIINNYQSSLHYPSFLHLIRKVREESSYFIFLAPTPTCCFISQTPEQLFCNTREHLQTEALAGTRPRASDAVEDQRLGDELLNSDKDNIEHQLVNHYLDDLLNKFCLQHSKNEIELFKLRYVQHLRTNWQGRVKENFNLISFLEEIHPTPALGGTPKEQAMEIIQQQEHFPRGLYGSPIGIISQDFCEMAVGIRSLLINQDQIHLFTGVGIVEQSQGAAEWQESEEKLQIFSNILQN